MTLRSSVGEAIFADTDDVDETQGAGIAHVMRISEFGPEVPSRGARSAPGSPHQ